MPGRMSQLSRPLRLFAVSMTLVVALNGQAASTPAKQPPASEQTAGFAAAAVSTTQPEFVQEIAGKALPINELFVFIETGSRQVTLGEAARAAARANSDQVRKWCKEGTAVYGITAALGPQKDTRITCAKANEFAVSTLRSNATGIGPTLPPEVARLTMLLRANMAAGGHFAGVRPELIQRYLDILNRDVVPVMHWRGSLGIGDLQPQADLGLVLIGDPNGRARLGTMESPADVALQQAGLPSTFKLEPGEALAILSGNTVVTAGAVWALYRIDRLLDAMDVAAAMFMDATRAKADPFDDRVNESRNIPGQIESAARIRGLLCRSDWTTNAGRKELGETADRVQDSTVVRATPQINGALREAVAYLRQVVERETYAATSNTLVFTRADGNGFDVLSGGNWDGTVLALALDHVNAALTAAATASERRSSRLISPDWSKGLPPNLSGTNAGESGLIQAQSLQLSIVTEMRLNAYPASVLSVPAKNYQEDTNSMSNNSLLQLLDQIDRAEEIVALEILMAAQGIALIEDQMGEMRPGVGSTAVQGLLAQKGIRPVLGRDEYLRPRIEALVRLVRDGELSKQVRAVLGTSPCFAPAE